MSENSLIAKRVLFFSVFIMTITYLSSLIVSSSSIANESQCAFQPSIYQYPASNEVSSLQPVLIFINGNESYSVEVSINITVGIEGDICPACLGAYMGLKFPQQELINYTFNSIPFYPGWSVAYIPGLITKNFSAVYISPILRYTTNYTVSVISSVSYKVVKNGIIIYEDSYNVSYGENHSMLPPITFIFIPNSQNFTQSSLSMPIFLPDGLSLGSGMPLNLIAVAVGENPLSSLSIEYSISGGPWISAHSEELSTGIENSVEEINSYLQGIASKLSSFGINASIPNITSTIEAIETQIPGQEPGNYVVYKSMASDIYNNTSESLAGMYYVYNSSSTNKILIVDPSVKLWLIYNSTSSFINSISSYNLSQGLINNINDSWTEASEHNSLGALQFHYWNLIGKQYRIYITDSSDLSSALEEYELNAIILSNLYLGLESSTLLDWDLKDNGALGALSSYVSQHHAGLIATQGSLSDWVIWESCSEKTKVGAKGNIDYNTSNLSSLDNLATLLGIPQLTLFEYVKDEVSNFFCINADPQVAEMIGSIPLQIPFVQFSGKLNSTSDAQKMGLSLPENFEFDNQRSQNGSPFLYTEVGWQLAFPQDIDFIVSNKINFSKWPTVNLSNSNGSNLSNYRNFSFTDMLLIYEAVQTSSIYGNDLNISFKIPGIGKFNITLRIPESLMEALLGAYQPKIVAISSDGLAGIIAYDKFWSDNGYRSVYFSFNLESFNTNTSEQLLTQAINWVESWSFYPNMTLLGDVLIPSDLASRAEYILNSIGGEELENMSMILNEEGSSVISINAESPGIVYVLILHPTSSNVEVTRIEGSYSSENCSSSNGISLVTIQVSNSTSLSLFLRAYSSSGIIPAYVEVKFEGLKSGWGNVSSNTFENQTTEACTYNGTCTSQSEEKENPQNSSTSTLSNSQTVGSEKGSLMGIIVLYITLAVVASLLILGIWKKKL
ncbi:hypothetical protein [Fervidicoccus fontis]|uniref:Uncharacterized protein n=1 Tax=Fervidicoccus fontis TaxID=683846 RepID=A0A7C2VJF1_9CREN|nr:hypothetical protein [Fervidicoccus fontis]HEW64243.1 hypothetical protein [Fervidicoccus fontis]